MIRWAVYTSSCAHKALLEAPGLQGGSISTHANSQVVENGLLFAKEIFTQGVARGARESVMSGCCCGFPSVHFLSEL